MSISDLSILITGGTGSFGERFVRKMLDTRSDFARVIVFSRDEWKQHELQLRLNDPRLRFFLGDVRDRQRLYRALVGVNVVVHAAALKQVTSCEYNPLEAVKTNVEGTANLIEAAIDRGVERVIALSTDKAVNPVNVYGATKLCGEKLLIAANAYSGAAGTRFSVVRYGNVFGSRGSVVPAFLAMLASSNGRKHLPVTHPGATRFWISLDEAVEFVTNCITNMQGGEIFVPKMRASTLQDLAAAVDPEATIRIVGLRAGEKLHETIIPPDETARIYDYGDHYLILSSGVAGNRGREGGRKGTLCPPGASYTSDTTERMSIADLQGLLELFNGAQTERNRV